MAHSVSQLTVNDKTYLIKDAEARRILESLEGDADTKLIYFTTDTINTEIRGTTVIAAENINNIDLSAKITDRAFVYDASGTFAEIVDTDEDNGRIIVSTITVPQSISDKETNAVSLSSNKLYAQKTLLAALPTDNEEYAGLVVQYVGSSTGSYVSGYFYKCQEVAGSDPVEYEWVRVFTQEKEETHHWKGTKSEYDAIKDTLPIGTYVHITDDYNQGERIPVGTIFIFAGSASPSVNWLICDGSPVSRTAYPELFSIIGTTYGEGDGENTFNIPDLREAVPVGAGQNATNYIIRVRA